MLDESLLDAPEALARADGSGLLLGAAESGARARTAIRQADDAGLREMQPDGRPRSILVAGHGPVTGCVADLLGAFCNGGIPVTLLRPAGSQAAPAALGWVLPGWAGPLDLLLLTTTGVGETGLETLVEQAYRRGCTVVAVAPSQAPLTEAVAEARGLAIPLANGPAGYTPQPLAGGGPAPVPAATPGPLWALVTPLLALADRLGLVSAPPTALQALADRLDRVAERCGPAVDTYGNPGKTLAVELAGALPLLWSEGGIAGAAARHAATTLGALAGRPALAAQLPEALSVHGALLTGAFAGGAEPQDFFRDRAEEQGSLHTRVVLLREQEPAGNSAAVAARELAHAHDTPLSELEPAEGSSPLEAAAELIATLDFAAVYLTLAVGDAS